MYPGAQRAGKRCNDSQNYDLSRILNCNTSADSLVVKLPPCLKTLHLFFTQSQQYLYIITKKY